jgi:hypothetical protein
MVTESGMVQCRHGLARLVRPGVGGPLVSKVCVRIR